MSLWQFPLQCKPQVLDLFFVDEQVLAAAGVTDFDQYAVTPDSELISDFFLDDAPRK